ncbi:MAG: DUF6491 family protein [Steroidobacteraceae bacterium]
MKHSINLLLMTAVLAVAVPLASYSQMIPLKRSYTAGLGRVEAYAGKPITSLSRRSEFLWRIAVDGWNPIAQNKLVVWTDKADNNQVDLITVHQPCPDLMFVRHIGLIRPRNLRVHLALVRVRGWQCVIDTIRPVDYLRMERDLRKEQAARQKATAATSSTSAARAAIRGFAGPASTLSRPL